MNCPACGTKDMASIPEAGLLRCTNCYWTVAQPEDTGAEPESKPKAAKGK